jgi:hypothetical protein
LYQRAQAGYIGADAANAFSRVGFRQSARFLGHVAKRLASLLAQPASELFRRQIALLY